MQPAAALKGKEEEEEEEDHEEAAVAIWDCGSPLYDSYELVSVSHLIERHLMAFPYLGGSSRRFMAKFSHSSSSETTNSSSTTSVKEGHRKGSSSSSVESLSEITGIMKMWKRKGLFGGIRKDKTKKMKTAGFSGFYSKLGLWRNKGMQRLGDWGEDEVRCLDHTIEDSN